MGADSDMNETGRIIESVSMVLEKFDGEVSEGNVVERLYVEDGQITKHEFLENGEVVRTRDLSNKGGD